MFRKNIYPKSRVFYSLLMPYLIIFLLLVTIYGIVNITNISKISSKQDESLQIYNLNIVQNSIENSLTEIRNIFSQVVSKEWTEKFANFDSKLFSIGQENAYDVHNVIEDLKIIKNSNKNIDVIGVFYRNADFVIDNENVTVNSTSYFLKTYVIQGTEASKWFSLSDDYYNFDILSTGKTLIHNRQYDGVTFIKTLPPNSDSKGLMFAFIDKEHLNVLLDSLNLGKNINAAIVDDKDNVIASTSDMSVGLSLPAYSEYIGSPILKLNGKETFIYYSKNINRLPWKVVLFSNVASNIMKSKIYYPHFLLYTLIIFLFGLLIIYLFSLYSYKSIKDFFNVLIDNDPSLANKKLEFKNEYAELQSMVINIAKHEKELSSNIEINRNVLRQNILFALSKNPDYDEANYFRPNELQNLLDSHGIPFIITAKICNNTKTADNPIIIAALEKHIQTICFYCDTILDCNDNPVFLSIINDNDSDAILKFKIIKHLDQFASNLKEARNISLYYGIGICPSSAVSLKSAYRQAEYLLKYNVLLNQNEYMAFIDFDIIDEISEILPLKTKAQILRLLEGGKFKEIIHLTQDFLKANSKSEELINVNKAELLFYELLSITLKFLTDKKIFNPDFYKGLKSANSIDDVIYVINEVCAYIKSVGDEKRTEKNFEVRKVEIVKYINENYLDHNICLNLLKDKFGISFSMITKIVQHATGHGFLDYLKMKRIEHSKTLLKNQDFTITKISELSGFNDISVFIKTFKNYSGITPGEYREKIAAKRRRV